MKKVLVKLKEDVTEEDLNGLCIWNEKYISEILKRDAWLMATDSSNDDHLVILPNSGAYFISNERLEFKDKKGAMLSDLEGIDVGSTEDAPSFRLTTPKRVPSFWFSKTCHDAVDLERVIAIDDISIDYTEIDLEGAKKRMVISKGDVEDFMEAFKKYVAGLTDE